MSNNSPDPLDSLRRQTPFNQTHSMGGATSHRKHSLVYFSVIAFILLIYSYPALRTRTEVQSTILPPVFAADLSLYLNLSESPATAGPQFLNPYYLVRVPYNGTGYLQFHLGPALFSKLRTALGERLWLSVFLWNVLWWSLLSIVSLWLLVRFLPYASPGLVVLGLTLLMLFNFGILKTLLTAWVHLPSLARFETIGLPFMRSFVPVMPVALLVAYLGLQMEVLRRRNAMLIWVAMGALQFAALATFPYATLMMAGITAVSSIWLFLFNGNRRTGMTVLVYGLLCGVADGAFLRGGSLGFYSGHASPIQFQPALLLHLVGGNWLILAILTTAVIFGIRLSPEVKWPLAGLGAVNLILMLGDAVVPAKTILLSHHAAHFIHATIAILLIFVISAALADPRFEHSQWRSSAAVSVVCIIAIVAVNALLLSVAAYRGSLAYNREEAGLAKALTGPFRPAPGDLVIARSQVVDDTCGWIFLLTQNQVLYCTDAEVMLTPQQNLDIHRFRQAIYLYFEGRDSDSIRRVLTGSRRLSLMYELGYWAEAASLSATEQAEGVRAVEHDLIPLVDQVGRRDIAVSNFFRQFRRIVVVDDPKSPTFSEDRLEAFLKLDVDQHSDNLQVRIYSAR
jgi:hypothetical protein